MRSDPLLKARWPGKPGRMEVWYATFTDPSTGDGYWIHAEITAYLERDAEAHGWVSHFPAAGGQRTERFGPVPISREQLNQGDTWFTAAGCTVASGRLTGTAGSMAWDLTYSDDSPPLYTFPRWAWERELLPGAKVVAAPQARFNGTVTLDGVEHSIAQARGALSHIYSKGSALTWGWLHADLPGGDVFEVIAPSSHRPLFKPLGVIGLLQLRHKGEDWPQQQLRAALKCETELALPTWSIRCRWGARRVHATVDIPEDRSVAMRYVDPDGNTATCTNSETASLHLLLERRVAGAWEIENEWNLEHCVHAELGLRP